MFRLVGAAFTKTGCLLDATSKQAIAQGITDMHCELTGAPRHFAHVLFQAYALGDCYTGGAPSKVANIRGAIRLGRGQETMENTGTNVMEGGALLPHPKDVAAWMAQNGFAPDTDA